MKRYATFSQVTIKPAIAQTNYGHCWYLQVNGNDLEIIFNRQLTYDGILEVLSRHNPVPEEWFV